VEVGHRGSEVGQDLFHGSAAVPFQRSDASLDNRGLRRRELISMRLVAWRLKYQQGG
jgi:hypothetical protein